jgi:hypothetical protein
VKETGPVLFSSDENLCFNCWLGVFVECPSSLTVPLGTYKCPSSLTVPLGTYSSSSVAAGGLTYSSPQHSCLCPSPSSSVQTVGLPVETRYSYCMYCMLCRGSECCYICLCTLVTPILFSIVAYRRVHLSIVVTCTYSSRHLSTTDTMIYRLFCSFPISWALPCAVCEYSPR